MTIKLFYFDAEGRAEVSRLMLRLAGVEFEDIRFPMARGEGGAWAEKYKSMSLTGQCPFLEVDGNIIAQTAAVEAYIGTLTGLLPQEPLLMAQAIMICQTLTEVWQTLYPTFAISDLAERSAARVKLMADDGATRSKLAALERMLASRSTAFSVTDDVTVADLNVMQGVKVFQSGMLDGIDPASLEAFPKLVELKDKVVAQPKVAALLTK